MTHSNLLLVYLPLIGWTATGWVLGRLLPPVAPVYLGRFLFWIGVPVGIVAFLRHTKLTFSLWIAPAVAWTAILTGIGLAWWMLQGWQRSRPWSRQTQGSFLLASMVGNTGYIGYPVSLALVGPHYFAWAVFYDLLGSTLGAYGLGVALASRMGGMEQSTRQNPLLILVKNPALWSFGLGILGRNLPLPTIVEISLTRFAWFAVSLSLILVGMRLSQLSSLRNFKPAILSVGIKMLLVPLAIGIILRLCGITGLMHRVLLLQMAMPPAFATLVISEAYELDPEFAVTALVTGSLGLFITLPLWLWLFGI
ncbi:AEC family transporter [Kovacikia minuta CCNUW1]|uniref:AEC family transporter n=1 Tax=Kovacikia minuta TaxID=2931930 RepID=UPI001CCB305E|nr:AEC family transporter [Kovacikia minuta]UBF26592.1 AEC family transporter [Kovacikia minuta CCNUW1]